LLHIDAQSGPDPFLRRRILLYNALLFERYDLPVHSIVLLLRTKADFGREANRVQYAPKLGRGGMEFTFEVIRLWEQPAESFLDAGPSLLPLAILADLTKGESTQAELKRILARILQRIENEADPRLQAKVLTSTFKLTNLRVPKLQARELFEGVKQMQEELTGYDEDMLTGEVRHAKRAILRQGRRRFGEPGQDVEAAIAELGIFECERLDRMLDRVSEAISWEDLLATA
jgi:hypothetical protein